MIAPGRLHVEETARVTARGVALAGLDRAAERLRRRGVPVPELDGKLLRPLFALALVPRELWLTLDDRFWSGALAIQMVHEASLLHDDVLDDAPQRRGRPTLAAERGVGAALVLGDHYLTGAYRAAADTDSLDFTRRFAEHVERTVAGEIRQGRAAGRLLEEDEYDDAITGKSGELFGAAGSLSALVAGLGDVEERSLIGLDFGNLYQRIDDLLDYCHHARSGKPPLQDYRQGKWSWVPELAGIPDFGVDEETVVEAIFGGRDGGPSAARTALDALRARARALIDRADALRTDRAALREIVEQCLRGAERGVADQEARLSPHGAPRATSTDAAGYVRSLASSLGDARQWHGYFGHHARTFHLAARLFPPREAGLVSALYAYCRFTDDLIDRPLDGAGPDVLAERLAAWRSLSLDAYDGAATGIPLLDSVLGTAAARGVCRAYPEALLDGVAMDLSPRRFATWDELGQYAFCVAGSIGGWISQLFDVEDPALLDRAHALGHAMQLTNIARDVGEDRRRGRLYLPQELLSAHGVDESDIDTMASGATPLSDAYRALVRELIARADAHYEEAWPGIRALPPVLRRPVAAAAAAYRGIHRKIRRNDWDNLTTRASTSLGRKLLLAGAGLVESRRVS